MMHRKDILDQSLENFRLEGLNGRSAEIRSGDSLAALLITIQKEAAQPLGSTNVIQVRCCQICGRP